MTSKWISTLKNLAVTSLMAVFFIVVGILIASKMHWTAETVAQESSTEGLTTSQETKPISMPNDWVLNGESPFVAVAEKVKPQVVNITSEREVTEQYSSPFDLFNDAILKDHFFPGRGSFGLGDLR